MLGKITSAMNTQLLSFLLILVAAGLAVVAYCHGNSDSVRGQMFTFAGAISTGAFALLNGTRENKSDPKE